MKPAGAKTLPVTSDLSYAALEEAARQLPPAHIYRLRVHRDQVREAMAYLGRHIDVMQSNPLSPAILIETDDGYGPFEWSLSSGLSIVWSPGVEGGFAASEAAAQELLLHQEESSRQT